MTRRLIAATLLASVVGGLAVTIVPAAADTGTSNYICVGVPDKGKDPHGMYAVCIDHPRLVGP
jgi:hypothetical protein